MKHKPTPRTGAEAFGHPVVISTTSRSHKRWAIAAAVLLAVAYAVAVFA